MENVELYREKRQLRNEEFLSRRSLNGQREIIKNSLLGSMGKDIDGVLSGKIKVRLSFWEKMKYKIRFWINNFFKIF